jgi:DNA adenine methylase
MSVASPRVPLPLKWHGGKYYLAPKIVRQMPPHVHYVEPYFGGGAVLLARDPNGTSEVVNDIHGELTNLWRVLQDEATFRIFQRILEATPFSKIEWLDAHQPTTDPVVRAVRFFVRARQSRAGQMNDFATMSRNRVRRGMNEQASAWITSVAGLPVVHARLQRVVIYNDDAIDIIKREDGPKTLFYCDPPYLHATRASTDAYEHEMTDEQHQQLLGVLASIKGKFLLSGYQNPMYDAYAAQHGWHRQDFNLPNNAAGGKEKRRMTESVWANYELLKQSSST